MRGRPKKTDAQIAEWFHQNYTMEPNTGCWLWMGRYDLDGAYLRAHITIRQKRVKTARYSYELHNGPIPSGALICHKCDVSLCVNPKHLYVGDAQSNARDLRERGWRKPGPAKGTRRSFVTPLPWAVLSDEKVREIRCNSRSGTELARTYGVSESTISRVRSRLTWKDVA